MISLSACQISIHAPARGATQRYPNIAVHNGISIHAPARGATEAFLASCVLAPFLSTLPQGERLNRTRWANLMEDFYPRSRKGSDLGGASLFLRQNISIHAPARGATTFPSPRNLGLRQFLSTLPQGERRKRRSDCGLSRRISIHAPARGATNISVIGVFVKCISIHAPARGATDTVIDLQADFTKFLSTLPQGERLPTQVQR